MSRERLQKALAAAGIASRRKVEEMIREGRVTVDGRTAAIGDQADLAEQAVKVDGKRILPSREPLRYILLYKPAGCVSTTEDPEGRPTVLDLLPERLRHGLVPVGRLDWGTEGLLILTDDGDLAHRLAHPRYGCTKTYEAKIKGTLDAPALARLRAGMRIDGKVTTPADVDRLSGRPGQRPAADSSWWEVVLSEGRNRQVREMFFRVGHPVQRLRRVAIGPLRDPRLVRGAWRELDEREVEMLRKATEPSRKKKSKKSRESAAPAKKTLTPRGRVKPERGKGRPERGKGRPERGRGKPERSDGKPERGKNRPERGRGKPERSDGSPERGNGSPTRGRGKPGGRGAGTGKGGPPRGKGGPSQRRGGPSRSGGGGRRRG